MKIVKAVIKKLLILTIVAGLPASWIMFENILNKVKMTASSIAINNLNHKKEMMRLKAKHKKEIAQLKLKNKKILRKLK